MLRQKRFKGKSYIPHLEHGAQSTENPSFGMVGFVVRGSIVSIRSKSSNKIRKNADWSLARSFSEDYCKPKPSAFSMASSKSLRSFSLLSYSGSMSKLKQV